MKRILRALRAGLWALLLGGLAATAAPAAESGAPPPVVRLAILRTGTASTLEGLVFAGGRLGQTLVLNHSAFLVEHPRGRFLFDTGLGRAIDAQFQADMPWWLRPGFGYRAGVPAAQQLADAGVAPPEFIVLSHGHWDHASGLPDFQQQPVRLPQAEIDYLQQPHRGAVFPSQLQGLAQRLQPLALEPVARHGFASTLDLFGDGAAIVVALPGHTPGSIGLLLRLGSGRRLLLVGDVVWSARALAAGAPKFAVARAIVDHDETGTQAAIDQLRRFMAAEPEVIVVPAHDAEVQERLGSFPAWVE